MTVCNFIMVYRETGYGFTPIHPDPNFCLTFSFFVLMLCSVLESDPEFGFEQAKRQLEGISLLFLFFIFPLLLP